jgi:hypothetical protein
MKRRDFLTTVPALALAGSAPAAAAKTTVSIQGERFFINGRPTYEGRRYQGLKIEGLLLNARLVQGIYDDLNPDTRSRWKSPDTGQWDAERNTCVLPWSRRKKTVILTRFCFPHPANCGIITRHISVSLIFCMCPLLLEKLPFQERLLQRSSTSPCSLQVEG